MSTPEDDLRALLRQEAQSIVPRGDGLTKIREGVARRRRRRLVLLPSAVLAATASLVAIAMLSGGGGLRTSLEQEDPAATPTSQPSPSASPTPGTTPSPGATFLPPQQVSYTGFGVWPFATAAEASAWDRAARPWAADPAQVAQHLVTDLLGLQASVRPAGSTGGRAQVEVVAGGAVVGLVELRQFTADEGRPWTVVAVTKSDLVVTSPQSGAAVASPLSVTGTVRDVDQSVAVRLLTTAGQELSRVNAPAGMEVPWQATLSWSSTAWRYGALAATTFSAKDGTLNRLVVLSVTRAEASSAASFVGLVQGHVSQLDSRTGAVVKQLTFPPAGKSDTGATWASGRLAWVRSSPTGCLDELNRLEGGTASTVVKAGTVRLSGPQLSPSGGLLAWRQQPCADGSPISVLVRGGGAPDRVLAAPSGMSADVLDLRDDGTLLVRLNDLDASGPGTIGVVPAGATSFAGSRPLAPTGSCYLAGAAAFDGNAPVAWETCGSASRLVRFSDSGARASAGPLVSGLAAPASTTVRNGAVLLQRGASEVARYAGGTLTTVANGVRAPDW